MSIFKDSLWYSVRLSAYFPRTVTAAIYRLLQRVSIALAMQSAVLAMIDSV